MNTQFGKGGRGDVVDGSGGEGGEGDTFFSGVHLMRTDQIDDRVGGLSDTRRFGVFARLRCAVSARFRPKQGKHLFSLPVPAPSAPCSYLPVVVSLLVGLSACVCVCVCVCVGTKLATNTVLR